MRILLLQITIYTYTRTLNCARFKIIIVYTFYVTICDVTDANSCLTYVPAGGQHSERKIKEKRSKLK